MPGHTKMPFQYLCHPRPMLKHLYHHGNGLRVPGPVCHNVMREYDDNDLMCFEVYAESQELLNAVKLAVHAENGLVMYMGAAFDTLKVGEWNTISYKVSDMLSYVYTGYAKNPAASFAELGKIRFMFGRDDKTEGVLYVDNLRMVRVENEN